MRGDRGSVAVVTAAIIVVVLALVLGAADLTLVLASAARAQTAADAAALAAAQELAIPSGLEPSDLAADYAARNGADLVQCACEAGSMEATVEVSVAVGPLLFLSGDRSVTARARAVVDVAGATWPPRGPS